MPNCEYMTYPIYSSGTVPMLNVMYVFKHFAGLGPANWQNDHYDADEHRVDTGRQPRPSKYIIINGGRESNQKDTPKVTTLCSNFNTSNDPAAAASWFSS